jgi:dethiobiotin synthase
MRGFFITGTDTGVGKTVVSAAVLRHLKTFGAAGYWKPIATGYPADDDTAVVAKLSDCEPEELFERGVRLRNPVSPHLAAKEEGVEINVNELLATLGRRMDERLWVVEGAGGVRVPINDEQFISDVMLTFDLPVIVVTRATLGTINHTLLTLEAIRHRQLEIAGVVIVGNNKENRDAIEKYGKAEILGEMPHFDPLDANAIRSWVEESFDRTNILGRRIRRWDIPKGVTL